MASAIASQGPPSVSGLGARWSVSVSLATHGQTDMRGLDTAGRAVRLERGRCLEIERRDQVFIVAHRCNAGPFHALRPVTCPGPKIVTHRAYSRVAKDQHQPDSSRATATVAMLGFFLRSMNVSHR